VRKRDTVCKREIQEKEETKEIRRRRGRYEKRYTVARQEGKE